MINEPPDPSRIDEPPDPSQIDETHDPSRTSWVSSANDHPEFPIQNLPIGVFSPAGGAPRGGIAIGDAIFDIEAALNAGLLTGAAREVAEAAASRTLNALLEAGAAPRRALRRRAAVLLDANGTEAGKARAAGGLLHDAASCALHLPVHVGNYTDFFAGIHHAHKGGTISRPDNPLMPNYKYVPVAYHGRASSVRVRLTAPAAQWPAQAAERGGTILRSVPQPGLRNGDRRLDRAGQ
jgi:fumarylacetoacetase